MMHSYRRSLRSFRADDRSVLSHLLKDCGQSVDGLFESDGFAFIIIYEIGTEIVGMAAIEPQGNDAVLRALAVRRVARRIGIGQELIDAAERAAQRGGFRALYVSADGQAPYFAQRGWQATPAADAPKAVRENPAIIAGADREETCMVKSLTLRRQPLMTEHRVRRKKQLAT